MRERFDSTKAPADLVQKLHDGRQAATFFLYNLPGYYHHDDRQALSDIVMGVNYLLSEVQRIVIERDPYQRYEEPPDT